jgi:hypothetical protein
MPLLLAAAVPVLTSTAAVPLAAAAFAAAPVIIGIAATTAAAAAAAAFIRRRARDNRLAAAGRTIGEALKRCKQPRCGMPLDANGHCLAAFCLEPDAPTPSVGLVPVCAICNEPYATIFEVCPTCDNPPTT